MKFSGGKTMGFLDFFKKTGNKQANTSSTANKVNDLFQQIIFQGIATYDKLEIQEKNLGELVKIGEKATPAIKEKVLSIINAPEGMYLYKGADRLCEAIGKIGGPPAFDTLLYFLNFQTRFWEYEVIRGGAVRGLGELGDKRAIEHLKALQQKGGTTQYVMNDIANSLSKLENAI